ncbi:MAG: hypothetical protein ACXW3L_01975 [Limisphaerales bacterium]
MNHDAPVTQPAPGPTLDQWRNQRLLLHCLSLSVLILTGTFFVYLYRQVVAIRKSTAEMVGFINQFEKSEAAEAIHRVQRQLDAYRKENPAFNPIYVKYFGTSSPPASTLSSKVGATNEP